MPSLEQMKESQVHKILLLGNGGSGKTGLLATLAEAGYRLFIFDFDSGTDILLDPKILAPAFRKNVFIQNFYDKHVIAAGKATVQPRGIPDFINALGSWKEGNENLGSIHTWGPKDVAIIDSLTFLGNACLNEALRISNHLGQRPTMPDWGTAIDQQESIIEMLYNPAVKCHVIVTSHLTPIGTNAPEAGGVTKLFPSALGSKFPPKIGRYFNNVVLLRKTGHGAAVKRELVTTATVDTDLKVSKPSKVPPVLEPNLAKLFELLSA